MEDNVIEQLIILANVTQDDIDNSVVDEFGVHYSNDGKRLIKGADIEEYCIKDGTEIICCSAFKDCKELSIIHFPSSVRYIGDYAFHSTYLKQLKLNEGLVGIGKLVFAFWSGVELDLTLPNSLTYLGEEAFMKSDIRTLDMGKGLKRIKYYAFGGCAMLKSIILNESVEYIGDSAFSYCGIDTFVIPKSVKEIDGNPFLEINSIVSESDSFIVEDDALYTADKKRIIACFSKKKKYIVQAPTEIIGKSCFKRTDIEEVVLPETVTEIGEFAFGSELKSINIPQRVTKISSYAFWGTDVETIELPNGIKEICDGTFVNSRLNTINLPSNLETIGDNAFQNCYNLESISFPPSLKHIGNDAFNGCIKLERVYVPKSVSELGAYAFPRTTEVIIDDESISYNAFDGVVYSSDGKTAIRLNGLQKEVTIKEGVEIIGEGAFCESDVEIVHLPSTLRIIEASAFESCYKLQSPSLPPSVIRIGWRAFSGCIFDSINLHEGITEIESECFSTSDIKHIKLPSTLIEIEDKLFSCCFELETVEISEGTERIGDGAFNCCHKLKSIKIPQSINSIGEAAFRNCGQLVEIQLPPIKEIPNYLFQYDTNLKRIHIPNTVEKVGKDAFMEVKPNYDIMPPRVKELIKGNCCDDCVEIEPIEECPF